jgi:hypothetical protein
MTLLKRTGTLEPKDVKQHLPFYFDLPEHCGKLELRFSYNPVAIDE